MDINYLPRRVKTACGGELQKREEKCRRKQAEPLSACLTDLVARLDGPSATWGMVSNARVGLLSDKDFERRGD